MTLLTRLLLFAALAAWGGVSLAAESGPFTLDLRQALSEASGATCFRVSSSAAFRLDLREAGAVGVAGLAQETSGTFALDLRGIVSAVGGFDREAATSAFVLDLRQIDEGEGTGGGDPSLPGSPEGCTGVFTLDLTQVDDPTFVGGTSATFALDLRNISTESAAGDGVFVCRTTGGFVLDLRGITAVEVPKEEIVGKTPPPEPTFDDVPFAGIVWKRADSAVFALDLRNVTGQSAGVSFAEAATGTFVLDLRNVQAAAAGERLVFLSSGVFVLDLRRISAEGVIVLPEDVTGGKELVVSEDWASKELDARFGAGTGEKFAEMYGHDLKAALTMPTGKLDAHGNELCVWHDFVAGTDPTDEKSVFKAVIEISDGKPVVNWSPALNGEGVQEGVRTYRVFGKKDLCGEWQEVNGDESGYNFFRVTVEMP